MIVIVGAGLAARQHSALRRFNTYDAQFWAAGLENRAAAGQRAV